MVKILQFILLIALLFTCAPLARAANPASFTPAEGECDLPAPENLVITNSGSTFISIQWASAHTVVPYNVRVKMRDQNGQWQLILDSMYVYGTTFTAWNLQPGKYYRLEVAAICDRENGGMVSNRYSSIEKLTLIIDLIPEYSDDLPVNEPGACRMNCLVFTQPEPGEVRWFDIVRFNDLNMEVFSRYQVAFVSDNKIELSKVPDINYDGQTWPSQPVNQNGMPPVQFGIVYAYILDENEKKVAKVTFERIYSPSARLNVCISIMERGYHVRCIPPNPATKPFGGEGSAERTAPGAKSGTIYAVNPFSDQLTIRTTDAQADNPLHIQLLDPNGRLVLDQKSPAGQEYNLPTPHLPPGLYVLRIRSNQLTHILKVIKSH